MMTHHVVHESFKNNISNNAHNTAQGGHPVFSGANAPAHPPKCNPGYNHHHHLCQSHSVMLTQNPEFISQYLSQEVSLVRMKVLPTTHSKDIYISPIGVILRRTSQECGG